MKKLYQWAGLSALYQALTYIFGIIFFIVVLDYQNITDITQKLTLIQEKQTIISLSNIFMYVLFGIALIPLSISLQQKLKSKKPYLAQTVLILGVIWAALLITSGFIQNATIDRLSILNQSSPEQLPFYWFISETITEAIGGSQGELLGGLYVLLFSIAGFQTKIFNKATHIIGILTGTIGVLSTIPFLHEISVGFGLLQIFWFILVGICFIKESKSV